MNTKTQQQKPAQGASSKAGRGVNLTIVSVGTRVRCGLYNLGAGVILAILGVQMPEKIESMLGGVCSRGGNAHFDVVFCDGSISRQVHESTVRGVQGEPAEFGKNCTLSLKPFNDGLL